jgi:hypothetical protein
LEDRINATRHVIIGGIGPIAVRKPSVNEVNDVVCDGDTLTVVGPCQPLLKQARDVAGKAKWLLSRIEGRSVDPLAGKNRCCYALLKRAGDERVVKPRN